METKTIHISNLELDPENPRLPEHMIKTEEDIVEYIARTTSIRELMDAIGSNGFFAGESIIAVPKNGEENGKYTVVEGNRRLTALKLLQDKETSSILGLGSVYDRAFYRPNEIPVAIYGNRDDVLGYLGNRHIAGVKAWEPLAKARYIKQLLDREDKTLSIQDRGLRVARKIGSRTSTVLRAAEGLAVLNFADSNGIFNKQGMKKHKLDFSVLTTALGYQEIKRYIASTKDGDTIEKAELKKNETKHLFEWMLKREHGNKTRLGDSRNLKMLNKILKHPEATKSFVEGKPLDDAHRQAGGETEEVQGFCEDIVQKLREVNSLIAEIEPTEIILTTIDTIHDQVLLLKLWRDSQSKINA